MPSVTVLIPTFNCSNYIDKCIASVLSQSYKDFEIIIVDDGSTDNTQQIISKFKDDRIKYVKNTINCGIVKVLNQGLDLANSEYIVRVDADDIMVGDRIAKQIDFLNRNLDYGLIGSSYDIINEKGFFEKRIILNNDPEYLRLGLLFRNQFHHSAITMRTELVTKLRYDNEYSYAEDYDLWLRFSKITKIANLNEIHLSYRWHNNNTCHQKQNELRKTVINILARELDSLEIEYTSRELVLHSAVCFGLGNVFFSTKEKKIELDNWFQKIFSSSKIFSNYSKEWLSDFQKQIFQQYN